MGKSSQKSVQKLFVTFLCIQFKKLKDVVILGNSLGGHVGLIFCKLYPKIIKGLVLTGSSGLYENSMGNNYPRRGDKEFVRNKTRNVFYNPEIATDELVDQVYEVINDRNTLIRTLAIAKSAVRHNMANDLPNMNQPTCLIWGKQDTVTPPEVAEDFHKLLPNSDLYWIDKCGHAAMMETPEEFNRLLEEWLTKRNI